MKKSCKRIDADCARIKHLCVKKEKVKKSQICDLKAKRIFLDGKNMECLFNQGSVITGGFDPEIDGVPVKPENVNQQVFDALLKVAEDFRESNLEIWNKGRERLSLPPSPGVDIFGYLTVPIAQNYCEDNVRLLNNLSYDLEIINPFESLNDVQIASIYINIGYINESGQVIINNLQIGNRQFQGSIDYDPNDVNNSFGEKFNGSLTLNTQAITDVYKLMSDLNNQAAVQLVLYAEKDLIIFEGGTGTSSKKRKLKTKERSVSTRETTTVPDVVGLFIDDAIVSIEDNGLFVNEIFEEYSDFGIDYVISQDPVGGTQVPVDSDVNITVSLGPKPQQFTTFYISGSDFGV